MKILITGIDGYLGWTLAQYLIARDHEVGGLDLFLRRKWVKEVGSWSATPIKSMWKRLTALRKKTGKDIWFEFGDLTDYEFVHSRIRDFEPDCIVHLGEMPSAPYSMKSACHTTFTMINNLIGTINILYAMRDVAPKAHLVKLGTMGEYGTPNIDIPEGFFECQYRGRTDYLPFPRQAGSWYHWTKVDDSYHIMFACKIWGLRSTDIMQGVVFGTRIDEMGGDERLLTRFDFDEAFGTCVNRYMAQAVVGHPLTPFGKGFQTRGVLPLRDSMQCMTLAIENPPKAGEYRTFNQFEQTYDVTQLAEMVVKVGKRMGLNVKIRNLENVRIEAEQHYYNPDHRHLLDLGYKPTKDILIPMEETMRDLIKYKDRIEQKKDTLIPKIRWSGEYRRAEELKKIDCRGK